MILIGMIEIKTTDKTGKILFSIPLRGNFDYFISENRDKKKETSPDFLIWNKSQRIGFLWKNKYSKNGDEKNYLSGNILALGFGLLDNRMKLVVFESEKQSQPGIWAGFVYWDDGVTKKDIDQKIEESLKLEDGIF